MGSIDENLLLIDEMQKKESPRAPTSPVSGRQTRRTFGTKFKSATDNVYRNLFQQTVF